MNGTKAERLELVRQALKINKSELARRTDTPQASISKFLAGQLEIGAIVSDRIVKKLGINAQWWETGQGNMFDDSLLGGPSNRLNGEQEGWHIITELVSLRNRVKELEADKVFLQEQVKTLTETIRMMQWQKGIDQGGA